MKGIRLNKFLHNTDMTSDSLKLLITEDRCELSETCISIGTPLPLFPAVLGHPIGFPRQMHP